MGDEHVGSSTFDHAILLGHLGVGAAWAAGGVDLPAVSNRVLEQQVVLRHPGAEAAMRAAWPVSVASTGAIVCRIPTSTIDQIELSFEAALDSQHALSKASFNSSVLR